jgi:putative hydrolase of the HAD superfamily
VGEVKPRALISDWGGVLTSPIRNSITDWITAERLDEQHYRETMRSWMRGAYGSGGENPIHALERGETPVPEFERALAAELRTVDGAPVVAAGLLSRMFGGFAPVEPMYEVLRSAKRGGVRTALLSNSWGNGYPRDQFAELFDAVVISGEVGMRKPEPRIYAHALDAVGLPPESCVFIDDMRQNIDAAEEAGMIGVHHTDPSATIARLEDLFGMPLRG